MTKKLYSKIEGLFEKLSVVITAILGNSITFILAVFLIIVYFADPSVYDQPMHRTIMDVIFSVTFLSLFVIQKTMNHFSKALHIKVNELVAAQDGASNRLINVEQRSEEELKRLADHFAQLAKEASSKGGSNTIENVIGTNKAQK